MSDEALKSLATAIEGLATKFEAGITAQGNTMKTSLEEQSTKFTTAIENIEKVIEKLDPANNTASGSGSGSSSTFGWPGAGGGPGSGAVAHESGLDAKIKSAEAALNSQSPKFDGAQITERAQEYETWRKKIDDNLALLGIKDAVNNFDLVNNKPPSGLSTKDFDRAVGIQSRILGSLRNTLSGRSHTLTKDTASHDGWDVSRIINKLKVWSLGENSTKSLTAMSTIKELVKLGTCQSTSSEDIISTARDSVN